MSAFGIFLTVCLALGIVGGLWLWTRHGSQGGHDT